MVWGVKPAAVIVTVGDVPGGGVGAGAFDEHAAVRPAKRQMARVHILTGSITRTGVGSLEEACPCRISWTTSIAVPVSD
jgi:hypothetical protein